MPRNNMREPLVEGSFQYREQDPDYKGQVVDYQLQNGPVENRPCRDVICAILFLATLGAMAYFAVEGFRLGDPSRLAAPFDSSGRQCQFDKNDVDYKNYPYIFAGLLQTQIIYVCVKQCPRDNATILQCKTMPGKLEDCSLLSTYNTTEIVNICVPAVEIDDNIRKIEEALRIGGLSQGFSDIRDTWPIILSCVGIAIVISLIFSIFIRYCAGCVVWSIILLLYVILGVGGTFAFLLRTSTWIQDIVKYQDFPGSLKDDRFLLGTAIVCWVLCALCMILTCCLYKQIRITVGIMKAAADFVRQQCSSYFIPFFIILLQIGFIAIWITIVLYLFSSGEVIPFGNATPFAWIVWNERNRYLVIFFLFGLLWTLVFLSGLGKFLVSAVVACWYYEETNPRHPFLKSLGWSIKVMGSIAFGSLLITIVMAIRIVLEAFHKVAKQSTMPQQNKKMIQCFVKCARCVIACFERLLRFITDKAYVMMAIEGKGFCQSASNAFYLVLRNTSQQFVTHSTLFLFKWFGKMFISFTTAFIGFIIITETEEYRTIIFSPLFPVLAFLLVSYPVGSTFMQFYAVTAKTLLMCYCIQKDLASRIKCPPALRNFIEDYVQDSEYYNRQ